MRIHSQPQNFGTQGFVIAVFLAIPFTSIVHIVPKHHMILSFSTLASTNQAISFLLSITTTQHLEPTTTTNFSIGPTSTSDYEEWQL